MPSIYHTFTIQASPEKVFETISTPKGLDDWWALSTNGVPKHGNNYELYFGPDYDWKAEVTKYKPEEEFELTMVEADVDWKNTKIGFILHDKDDHTEVDFYHKDWPEANKHFKISSYCWAIYLRLLKRNIEKGEVVPYEERTEL